LQLPKKEVNIDTSTNNSQNASGGKKKKEREMRIMKEQFRQECEHCSADIEMLECTVFII
jgi:hypothetical protein